MSASGTYIRTAKALQQFDLFQSRIQFNQQVLVQRGSLLLTHAVFKNNASVFVELDICAAHNQGETDD